MSNIPNEINKLEKITKPSILITPKENLDLSVLSVLGLNLASVTPYQKWIPSKNKRKETPAALIIRKEPIQETVNPRNISGGFFNASRKRNPTQNVLTIKHKEYYEGDTDVMNRNTNDSKYENDDFVRNLEKEQEYK